MTKAHILNHYLRATVRGAERLGHPPEALLAQAGIPAQWLRQPDRRITEAQLTRLIQTVWRCTRDEFMGFSTHACHLGTFALMADYCLGSATLGAILRKSARFYRTLCDNLDIGFEPHDPGGDRQVFFRLSLRDSRQDSDHLLQEFLLLMWQRFSCWWVSQRIPFATTRFSYPAPAYILHRPSQDGSLGHRVRALLSAYSYSDMPGLEALARQLHMTPRSIGRKLQEEGTSLRDIKTSLRREHAIRLMSTENLTIAEISERVGFSETASFCRAFKRWTGKSPSHWND
ncbi:AraC family transcriptional regulator [Marinobacter lutaoensis]|nr:AraC family transcriptional regulator [Marinobacter lutaoensis]